MSSAILLIDLDVRTETLTLTSTLARSRRLTSLKVANAFSDSQSDGCYLWFAVESVLHHALH